MGERHTEAQSLRRIIAGGFGRIALILALGGALVAIGGTAAGPGQLGGEAQGLDRLAVLGERLFIDECAVCHGIDAQGTGPLASVLSVAVPDLTGIAEANGGAFPASRLHAVIDGRRPIGGHGPSEMPIWGEIFRADAVAAGATGGYRDLDAELLVAGRISAILRFLEAVQTP
ncbi:MAG: c-type cytochrome [Pseudomonadota bacterium]